MTVQLNIIKNKVGLLQLTRELDNLSRTRQVFGYSRDSYYLLQNLNETGAEQVGLSLAGSHMACS
jgi:hypothetical protein